MNHVKSIILILAVALMPLNLFAEEKEKAIDIPEIVLHHMSDAYEWHVAGDVSIPLPIIVKGEDGWFFGTSKGIEEHKTLFFNEAHHGKIYERMPDGTVKRPFDISMTKTVCQIWIVAIILIVLFLSLAKWYKKRDCTSEAPRGFVGAMEMIIMLIHDDVVKGCVGEKHYRKFAPYLLTVFFFILVTNLLGLLPLFPGGANVTGNINITFFLAICTMLVVNIFGSKEYWKEIFWPEVPLFLKAYPAPLIPLIEVVGIFTKPFALMVRLFANMMAGHAIILSFTCVIFLGWTLGVGMGIGLNLFSAMMLLFMNCVEILVAFVQAYVFTLLSAVFIGLAHPQHHGS
ncbi:MAG: F0F1 ATP synthase subunit A [Prevotella sp.]|uniref:F0F1 ATP synthase subunit A n=1 Tax=Prevotella sp. TaxID=59823 RepID=UPI002A263640|nr:F0F1 ATP synthase subunit A [Prevotella sp.]MDD7319221.1 F0F1 ATP synthase subunit A [Prevotellaceae bacterium]MDY4020140.1 F0F1 ATP synthase subunit A [Prevotella sp.]